VEYVVPGSLVFDPGEDQEEKPQGSERRQTEVKVDVGEQAALRNHIRLEDLQSTQFRITSPASIAVDESCILGQLVTAVTPKVFPIWRMKK
jgi:hypothetical protein